jgi:hypothetical protein
MNPSDERPAWWTAFIDRFERLDNLIEQGVSDADDEQLAINTSSQFHAQRFAAQLIDCRRPGVFIDLNGCVRLVWDAGEEQVALLFNPRGRVGFVFLRLDGEGAVDDLRGTVRASLIMLLIERFEIKHVMLDRSDQ